MTTHRSFRVLALVLTVCFGLVQPARAQSTADTVVEWNRILAVSHLPG